MLTNPHWVPWDLEVSLRKDRLHRSLKAAGCSTLPGTFYLRSSRRNSLGAKTLNFKEGQKGPQSAKLVKRWVVEQKSIRALKLSQAAPEGSTTWWACRLEGGADHGIGGLTRLALGMLPLRNMRAWDGRCPYSM